MNDYDYELLLFRAWVLFAVYKTLPLFIKLELLIRQRYDHISVFF